MMDQREWIDQEIQQDERKPVWLRKAIRFRHGDTLLERPVVASVSGHLDGDIIEYGILIAKMIDLAMKEGHHFVMANNAGRANPFHSMLLRVLSHAPERLTLLYVYGEPLYDNPFKKVTGFATDRERNEALMRMADYDIAWYPHFKFNGPRTETSGRQVATAREKLNTLSSRPRYENMQSRPKLELENDLFMIQAELERRKRNQTIIDAPSMLDEQELLKSLDPLR